MNGSARPLKIYNQTNGSDQSNPEVSVSTASAIINEKIIASSGQQLIGLDGFGPTEHAASATKQILRLEGLG